MVAASQNAYFNEALCEFLSLIVTDCVINSLVPDSSLDSYQEPALAPLAYSETFLALWFVILYSYRADNAHLMVLFFSAVLYCQMEV